MQEIKISENEAGQRLTKLLEKYLSKAPKSFYYKMLRKKNIVLNGKKAAGNEQLKTGDVIRLYLAEDTIAKFSGGEVKAAETDLDIIYEDEDILFINKPAGMLSQKAEADDTSLVEYITGYLLKSGRITQEELKRFRPGICNRLDRNTSGLIAAGKSLPGLQVMNSLFKTRVIGKYYRCLVKGEVTKGQHIDGWLKKQESLNTVTVESVQTKDSVRIETAYEPVRTDGNTTLLEVHLLTGKTHQIRAHLAGTGHPIIGDYKYGDRKVNDCYKSRYGLKSQLLHAYRLEIPKDAVRQLDMDVKSPGGKILARLSGKQYTAPVPDLFERICGQM